MTFAASACTNVRKLLLRNKGVVKWSSTPARGGEEGSLTILQTILHVPFSFRFARVHGSLERRKTRGWRVITFTTGYQWTVYEKNDSPVSYTKTYGVRRSKTSAANDPVFAWNTHAIYKSFRALGGLIGKCLIYINVKRRCAVMKTAVKPLWQRLSNNTDTSSFRKKKKKTRR